MNTGEQPTLDTTKKPEGQTAESFPLQERTPAEDWKDFSSRVKTESSDGVQGAQRPERKDTDLKKLTPEQLEHWNKTGEVPGPKQDKDKEPTERKSDAKPAKEGEGDSKQTAEAESQQTPQQRAHDRLLERAAKEPEFERVVERLHEPFFPLSAEGHARYQVLAYALREVTNSDDVIYYLSRPENSSAALKMQDASPYQIAQAVHKISAELRFGSRTAKRAAEEPREPRAPRPPSEVGGRGTSPTDTAEDAVRRNDFRAAEAEWNRRAIQRNSATAKR